MRSNTMAIFVLFGGVFFTVFAVLAGIDIALAVQLQQRFYSK